MFYCLNIPEICFEQIIENNITCGSCVLNCLFFVFLLISGKIKFWNILITSLQRRMIYYKQGWYIIWKLTKVFKVFLSQRLYFLVKQVSLCNWFVLLQAKKRKKYFGYATFKHWILVYVIIHKSTWVLIFKQFWD